MRAAALLLLLILPAAAGAAPPLHGASRVCVENSAAFVLKWRLRDAGTGRESGETGGYPVTQQRCIDGADVANVSANATLLPVVAAVAGDEVAVSPAVRYDPAAPEATYTCRGTTLDFECSLFARCCDFAPRHVHLAFAGRGAVSVSWLTVDVPDQYAPAVQFGAAPGQYTRRANGSSSQYFVRHHHDVVVDVAGFPAGAPLYYRVGDAAAGWSAEFSFRSPRPAATSARVAIIGDMGVNNSAGNIRLLADAAGGLDAIVHVGDVSYADDLHAGIEPDPGPNAPQDPLGYEFVYDQFAARVEPITSQVPYMVCPGNHDVTCHVTSDSGCAAGQRNFSALRHRWRMPSAESGAGAVQGMWYSWDVGTAHFVSITAESDFPGAPTTPGTILGGGKGGGFGDQLGWLDRDLAQARASGADWIIVYGHRPMYPSHAIDWPLGTPGKVKKAFEPIFTKYAVDVYACAHQHYYERTWPLLDGEKCAGNYSSPGRGCVTHVVNGAGGNNEGADGPGDSNKERVATGVYSAFGTAFLDINRTHLVHTFVTASDGKVADRFVISK